MSRRERVVRVKRHVRELTRIKRDIRGWIGWDYIEECTNRSSNPTLIMAIFLTGGRATEILELTRGHFADMGAYYEVRAMPVFKKFDVLETILDEITGKKKWITQLVYETRTFPILKSEPFADRFWKEIKGKKGKLFEFKIPMSDRLWSDQYWQLYKVVSTIDPPESPLAPRFHTGEKRGLQKNLYPHWFRGMRAAQMRVEYALTADDLMEFFRWEDPEMALYYTSLTSYELADKMMQGRDRIRRVMGLG